MGRFGPRKSDVQTKQDTQRNNKDAEFFVFSRRSGDRDVRILGLSLRASTDSGGDFGAVLPVLEVHLEVVQSLLWTRVVQL